MDFIDQIKAISQQILVLNSNESSVNELKRFSKTAFNPSELGDAARSLLYTKEIKRIMAEQLNDPSPDFVKFFASQVYAGRMAPSVVEKFTEITRRSLKDFINDLITDRLSKAIDLPDATTPTPISADTQEGVTEPDPSPSDNGIATTEEELEGFYVVKAILREVVDISRIQFKDTKSYFGINLDGKVSKTLCRLWFNSAKKSIGILDAEGKEAKKNISSLDEIYGLAEILKDRAKFLTQNGSTQAEVVEQ